MPSASEWVALRLWEYSFIPLGAACLALGLAAAAGVWLLLTRKMRVSQLAAASAALALGTGVFAALVLVWTVGVIVPTSGPVRFDARGWHVEPWERWGMAQHLVDSGQLLGMEQEDARQLLGSDDGSYQDMAEGREEWDSWRLYRSQDLIVPRPPELVIFYEDGRVARVWIEPW